MPIEAALLKSTESAVRALRALQSEVFADECLQRDCAMDDDPGVRSWQLCALTPMSLLDQFKVISLSNPNDRLRLLAEICCERYGDYQRMLAVDDVTRAADLTKFEQVDDEDQCLVRGNHAARATFAVGRGGPE